MQSSVFPTYSLFSDWTSCGLSGLVPILVLKPQKNDDAEEKKLALIHLLDDAAPVEICAENVDQIDGAGLQLLATFVKDAISKNIVISWAGVSGVLLDAVKVVGLTDALQMQDVEVENDGEGESWGLF